METFVYPVGQLQTNCYLVVDQKTHSTLIIDPGDDADYLIRIISDKRLKPILIVTTHGHFDHLLAVWELKMNYHIPFRMNKNDDFLLQNMVSSAKHFLNIDVSPPPTVDKYLKEEDSFNVGEKKFKIIGTPGHTPGSICLYQEEERFLFCGDLLFSGGGVGKSDFSYSNEELLHKSIKKILTFPQNIHIFPGHGQSFKLADWYGLC